MAFIEGGCSCGDVRYAAHSDPVRVAVCFCRACRQSTGLAGVLEPLFERASFRVTFGRPTRFTRSEPDSTNSIAVSFCPTCGTKLFLEYGEADGMIGVFAETLDEAHWLEDAHCEAEYLFLDAPCAVAAADHKVWPAR